MQLFYRVMCVLMILMSGSCTISLAQTQLAATGGATLIPIAPGWAGNTLNVTIFRHIRDHILSRWDAVHGVLRSRWAHRAREAQDRFEPTGPRTRPSTPATSAMPTTRSSSRWTARASCTWRGPATTSRSSTAAPNEPGSIEVGDKTPMTGASEDRVTYPEFYNMPDGGLLFMYRVGASGNGNLVLNHYDAATQKWTQVQPNLIDGQGKRNAYWQASVDAKGTIHLSWVWRDSPDVATNHDLSYARSSDGGKTWQKTDGSNCPVPITIDTAEVAAKIPQNHELINQTTMTTDSKGRPYIATYWRDEGTEIPQYHIVYFDGAKWQVSPVGGQTLPFRLSGGGSKRLPLSRPKILADSSGAKDKAYLLFRDEGRGNKISVASCDDLTANKWTISDLTTSSVGQWEPNFDLARWQRDKVADVFVQRAEQKDAEGVNATPPEMVYVLEWEPRE